MQVTEQTTALKEATTVMSDTRRKYQALDIELQSELSLVRTFVLIYLDSYARLFSTCPAFVQ